MFLDDNTKWATDIVAESNGNLAVLLYSDIKNEIRKAPKGLYKVMEIAANYAYEVNHVNLMGKSNN
jgi:UDP-N-acetylglucosamine pyrophosphorylase